MKDEEQELRDYEPQEEVFTTKDALFLATASLAIVTLIRILWQLIG